MPDGFAAGDEFEVEVEAGRGAGGAAPGLAGAAIDGEVPDETTRLKAELVTAKAALAAGGLLKAELQAVDASSYGTRLVSMHSTLKIEYERLIQQQVEEHEAAMAAAVAAHEEQVASTARRHEEEVVVLRNVPAYWTTICATARVQARRPAARAALQNRELAGFQSVDRSFRCHQQLDSAKGPPRRLS